MNTEIFKKDWKSEIKQMQKIAGIPGNIVVDVAILNCNLKLAEEESMTDVQKKYKEEEQKKMEENTENKSEDSAEDKIEDMLSEKPEDKMEEESPMEKQEGPMEEREDPMEEQEDPMEEQEVLMEENKNGEKKVLEDEVDSLIQDVLNEVQMEEGVASGSPLEEILTMPGESEFDNIGDATESSDFVDLSNALKSLGM